MENDVFALIFFHSLIWCRYGAAELAPGLPVLAGSSAPGIRIICLCFRQSWPRIGGNKQNVLTGLSLISTDKPLISGNNRAEIGHL